MYFSKKSACLSVKINLLRAGRVERVIGVDKTLIPELLLHTRKMITT